MLREDLVLRHCVLPERISENKSFPQVEIKPTIATFRQKNHIDFSEINIICYQNQQIFFFYSLMELYTEQKK